jgi:hypothetical protein
MTATCQVESTLDPGTVVTGYTVHYKDDDTYEDIEETEIRKLIVTNDMPERKSIIASLKSGFEYLEDRLTGNCASCYDCRDTYELFRLVQVFDPVFASAECVGAETVKGLAALPCFENLDALIAGMIVEIPKYMASASSLRLDRADVAEFSKGVLQFWRSHATEMPHWAEAARIVFSMAPSSAACERVFSLLASMFDMNQRHTLMDFVEGSLMLNYNDRVVG